MISIFYLVIKLKIHKEIMLMLKQVKVYTRHT